MVKGQDWNNYVNFRDYLNENHEKAKEYNELKQKLSKKYSLNRQLYSIGKQELIDKLLIEAEDWRKIDFIISSPLKRAIDTSKIISESKR